MCFVWFSEHNATGFFFYSDKWVVIKDCVYCAIGVQSSTAVQVIVRL